MCEWHSAAFNVRDGQRVKGPAQQETRLLTLPTRIEEGVLTYVYGK
jgi:nitrite reductase/ring-hydroxylating ferredoxin subunit